jgi:hypothetical protein
MATQRSSFAKRERDRAKKARAAAKREARLERKHSDDNDEEEENQVPTEDPEVLMEKLAKLHEAFDDDKIEFEEFEEQKADLMARMPID